MDKLEEMIQDAEMLPVDSEIEKDWMEVAKQRAEEVVSGEVEPIPWKVVRERVHSRFQTCRT